MQDTTWQAPRNMEAASRERLAAGYRPSHGAQGLFIAAGVVLAMGFRDFDLSRLVDHYPGVGMFLLHYAGWLVAAVALLMLVALWPAWVGSGWRVWRRLHFSLFALTLALMSLQLWQWRIIGATEI